MRIGFVGLGRMGSGMAGRLLDAGFTLTVHDLSPEVAVPLRDKGAHWAGSLADLAAASDVILTSLPRPEDVLACEPGLVEGLRPGSVWLDLSTNALDVVRALHGRMAERQIAFLDGPVSGGPAGAASGKLAIWIGGEAAAYEKILSVLEAMADRPRYLGGIGAGTISKLVHNTIAATINHAVAEMMTVGVKAGMEPLALYEAIRSGAMGRMRAFDNIHPRWLAGALDPPTFALDLLLKDVALGVALAESVDAPAPLASQTRDDLAEAATRGWGGRDAQSALLLAQERAGIPPISAEITDIRAVMDRS